MAEGSDDPKRGTGFQRYRGTASSRLRRSAARRLKDAEGGAPRGVRMGTIRAASWLNGSGCYSTRLAALRQPRIAKRPQAGLRAGRIMRHSRAQPSGPTFGRPKDKLRADPGISGREGAGWTLLRPEMLGSSPSMTVEAGTAARLLLPSGEKGAARSADG